MRVENIRPAWLEINLSNLVHNLNEIKRILKPQTEIMAVVKANAYNHDSVIISRKLIENGVNHLAVSILSEGIRLRRAGISVPILMLNYTDIGEYASAIENDLTLTVYNLEQAKRLDALAKSLMKTARIHIKLDTGMSRLGYVCTDSDRNKTVSEIKEICLLENVKVDGIYTHFAKSDFRDKECTREQYARFKEMIGALEAEGVNIEKKHVSNSAAIIDLPEYDLNFVRPGCILYGYYPSNEVNRELIDLKPLMQLKAKISNIKTLPEGVGISYGHAYITDKETVLATIPLGYSDGYSRLLSNKAKVFVNGVLCPSRGMICMDQFMVDVTDVKDVAIGDEVVLFGYEDERYPSVEELSELMGTIHYEFVCMMSLRIPRIYIDDGRVTDVICDPEY